MKNPKSTVLRGLALGAASVLALTACGGGSDNDAGDGSSAAGGEELRDVSLMLNWYPYGEHVPFYYGVEEGIFEEHGIDLTIEPGQGSTKTTQAIGAGEAEFGWADTPAVLGNIDNGVGVKSVGVFLQTTPSAVQVFTDSGIEEPADLEGKTIAVSAGDAPTTTFPMYLEAAGVPEDAVTQQNLDPAGKNSAMLSGQVDGLIGFAHDQGPIIADQSGRDITYLRYSDVGLNFYSNGLIVSDTLINDDPELIDAMVAATSEAFAAASENVDDAVAAMDGKDPQMPNADVLKGQWEQTIDLLNTDATEGKAPGVNAPEDWQNTLDVLGEAGLIDGGSGIDTYFDDSFSPESQR